MYRAFQGRLFVILLSTFIFTFTASYILQTREADRYVTNTFQFTLKYIKSRIDFFEINRETLKKRMVKIISEKAQSLALNLHKDKNLQKDEDYLKNWCEENQLQEITLFDEEGHVISRVSKQKTTESLQADEKYQPLIKKNGSLFEEYCDLTDKNQPKSNNNLRILTIAPKVSSIGLLQFKRRCKIDDEAMETTSIKNLASYFKISQSGFVLIMKDGKIISSGRPDFTEEDIKQIGLWKQMYDSGKQHEGLYQAELDGEKLLFYYVPYKQYMLIAVYPANEVYKQRDMALWWETLCYLTLYMITFILLSILIKRVVISGIRQINTSLEKITAGDLTEEVNVKTSEEFISLSNGINITVTALRRALENEKERINQELDFAHKIQSSVIPKNFPPFPDKCQFDIFASMQPAKEVSGDFYDFALLGKNKSKLGFIIADVSGKGIPAALFMMSAKTLIKNYAEMDLSPAEIFTKANRQLCKHNDTFMFVTAFVGILDLETGILTYTNAGHNPPYLKRADGNFEQIKVDPAFALGCLNKTVYQDKQLQTNFGDTLFLYTDGITEGQDKDEEFYGEARLEKILNDNKDLPVTDLLLTIQHDINEFEKNTEQADDITMMGLKFTAQRIEIPARIEQTEAVIDFIQNLLAPFESESTIPVSIAAEEIFVNIANYAYQPEENGTVSICCAVGGYPRSVSITFTDCGVPFNPLNKPDPDVTLPLEEREAGNLGIYMVKKLMDSAVYTYRNNQNVFTFKKRL